MFQHPLSRQAAGAAARGPAAPHGHHHHGPQHHHHGGRRQHAQQPRQVVVARAEAGGAVQLHLYVAGGGATPLGGEAASQPTHLGTHQPYRTNTEPRHQSLPHPRLLPSCQQTPRELRVAERVPSRTKITNLTQTYHCMSVVRGGTSV